MAYAATSDVAALCQNTLGGASVFSASTSPTDTAVSSWLAQGYAILNTSLNGLGYTAPAASSATIYNYLVNLNTLYAAGYTELSRINVTLAPGERTRGQVFLDMFWKGLDRLSEMDLSATGVSADSNIGSIYAGGTSIADKESNESDTDRPARRFTRGQFRFPGSSNPSRASDNS